MSQYISVDKFEELDPKQFIIIKGARVNNLKNLSVAIPRNRLVVVTGLSGSGKSSLAFDTLFAEGQRMYVESLSSYARQFLGRMEKPEVDYIKGVAPAIAIEQKVNTRNPRSTVGTSTEIYDYLKLLFARVGKTISPISGNEVTKHSVTDVVDFIFGHEDGTRLTIMGPLRIHEERTVLEELKLLLSKGYTRVVVNGEPKFIEELVNEELSEEASIKILIDRIAVKHEEEEYQYRVADSVQTAFFEGEGECEVLILGGESYTFSDKFELDGVQFEEPSVNLFTFNNPYGACKKCEGFGHVIGVDPDLVIPNKNLSVYENAILPWRGETMKKWKEALISHAMDFDFPVHRPIADLTKEEEELLWTGNKHFKGLNAFFKFLESKTHKIQYRVMLSRYRGRTICPECHGTRLRKDAGFVKIGGKSIIDVVLMPVKNLIDFFDGLELTEHESKVAKRILAEIRNRLHYLDEVGLNYLTLNRLSSTLSGGEYQRIKLATSLGSALVGSMYILDEPSIGLHPRDTARLISVLKTLRDLGNTVIVVEHEEEVMRAADQIIDIGPDAGSHGGELVFQGTLEELSKENNTYTARYLNGENKIDLPEYRRQWRRFVEVKGARENNLKNIDVKFPLGVLSVITGVSGSGKSTLLRKLLYPSLSRALELDTLEIGKMDELVGDYDMIKSIEFIDQNPIGKSSRSNPVTYVKAYDPIRQLYADQALSKQRGYKPAHFSFNVDGGRCEMCQGEGTVKIEMQFMADLYLTCESCQGKRFKKEILDVQYNEKNISDVLDMTLADAMTFFEGKPAIVNKLKPLYDVGLGYITLGQSASSLSGGEAQRVKLASYLGKSNSRGDDHKLFIFDEPTTGLHFHDIKKLLNAINELIKMGHSVIIIEHNMEVIKTADWIIDLGPDGGENGGYLNFAGTPEDMVKLDDNHTAKYLREHLQ
ncbi:excinuclease ABC subunit UvrA [Aureibacter tunicatorum]|uniref:UvrABC system protein A n=1 Tax=Aureibacter tunicatorum TaxID=866807 RepID=A0AAE4BR32_9BACT|nr:excinuclease ABC subunit UvrA [Aureibacter tunicatorum]MDR6237523.1 excinuclease ABC subunit A [Aureibacter tunicatorum]BDD02557.1 UvrABC system protein A [Aureibacter tunicatorum]